MFWHNCGYMSMSQLMFMTDVERYLISQGGQISNINYVCVAIIHTNNIILEIILKVGLNNVSEDTHDTWD